MSLFGTCPDSGHVPFYEFWARVSDQSESWSQFGHTKKLVTICIDQSESWAQTWVQFFARAYSESQ